MMLTMTNVRSYVFILWGSRFDEVSATIFVSELRQAGLRVKVVSLNSQNIIGASGLALVPDMTLGKALTLVSQATCIIVPYIPQNLRRFRNDPRLIEFFDQARTNRVQFVISSSNECQSIEMGLLPTDVVTVYPTGAALIEFAREVGHGLTQAQKS